MSLGLFVMRVPSTRVTVAMRRGTKNTRLGADSQRPRLASLAGDADFQFLDQRLDRATIVQNVGIERRTFGQEHADTFDSDVGDTGALTIVAHFPLDLDRQAAGVAEEAVDDPYAVGPRDHL